VADAKGKALLILGLSLFLAASVSGISFKVQVSDVVDYDTVGLDHQVNGSIVSVETSVENTGSIGCRYRLSGEFDNGERVTESWSNAVPLFPGGNSAVGFKHMVYNYTGRANASIDLSYCGETTDVGNFTFNVTERRIVNDTLESETRSVNSSAAVISTEVENGTLIPETVPAGWKVPGASVTDGKAVLEYEPTIFHPERELSYFVVDEDGEIRGVTRIDLSYTPGIVEKIFANKFKLLLGASLLVNLLLLARLRSFSLDRLKALK
jgi:hypothetical protein